MDHDNMELLVIETWTHLDTWAPPFQDTDSSAVAATSAVDPGVDEDGKVEKEDSSSALNMEQLKILVSL